MTQAHIYFKLSQQIIEKQTMILSQIMSEETYNVIDWSDEKLITYDKMKNDKDSQNILVINTKSGLSTKLNNNFKKISAV